MDEDVEFRDMIIKNLEKTGYLRKLKAKLRAQIFEHVKDDISSTVNINDESENKGEIIALYLVQDLLECLNLSYTNTVLLAESGFNKNNVIENSIIDHDKILEMLEIKTDDKNFDRENNIKSSVLTEKEPLLIQFINMRLNNNPLNIVSAKVSTSLDDSNNQSYVTSFEFEGSTQQQETELNA